jgi:hypothetical protein
VPRRNRRLPPEEDEAAIAAATPGRQVAGGARSNSFAPKKAAPSLAVVRPGWSETGPNHATVMVLRALHGQRAGGVNVFTWPAQVGFTPGPGTVEGHELGLMFL